MLDFQANIFDVPGAQSVIFTVTDNEAAPRNITLKNLSAYTLTCQYQKSTDGGLTWVDLGSAFDLEPEGSGGAEMDMRTISDIGRIRLLASGGSSSRELFVSVHRVSLSPSASFPLFIP